MPKKASQVCKSENLSKQNVQVQQLIRVIPYPADAIYRNL